MQIGKPSLTALASAAHRATHQLVDERSIFRDPLAVPILGRSPASLRADAIAHPERRAMRRFIAARSQFAEDTLAAAVRRRVRQFVILGAGLDTFAYRNPYEGLTVFEVDHPATQAWKRERLAAAGIAIPPGVRFAAVDFERVGLVDGLASADFDSAAAALFSWLGVVVYLSEAAIFETLGFMAGLPAGSEVVFSYSDPPKTMPPAQADAYRERAARLSALGEAWRTQFEPSMLHARLRELGFRDLEDLGPADVAARYLGQPAVPADAKGGHLIRARLGGTAVA